MRFVQQLRARSLTLALVALACAHCGSVKGADRNRGADAGDGDPDAAAVADGGDPATEDGSESTPDGGPEVDSGGPAIVVGTGSDTCATATPMKLSGLNPRSDLMATTVGATHEINAPCSSGPAPDTFYKFSINKRVLVYADTFGANWDTVLFLLSDSCVPIATSTTSGDAVCNDNGCGSQQSQIVALLNPGTYRLGLTGNGGAQGNATIHFEWARAGSGTIAHLPSGNTVQVGTTSGSEGNIDGLSSDCIAAGAENSYWWARCPSDPAQTMLASTCGAADFESVVSAQIPKSAPGVSAAYKCNRNGCGGLQSRLSTAIPAGAGLGVLSVDGEGGSDVGPYTMTVTYSP